MVRWWFRRLGSGVASSDGGWGGRASLARSFCGRDRRRDLSCGVVVILPCDAALVLGALAARLVSRTRSAAFFVHAAGGLLGSIFVALRATFVVSILPSLPLSWSTPSLLVSSRSRGSRCCSAAVFLRRAPSP